MSNERSRIRADRRRSIADLNHRRLPHRKAAFKAWAARFRPEPVRNGGRYAFGSYLSRAVRFNYVMACAHRTRVGRLLIVAVEDSDRDGSAVVPDSTNLFYSHRRHFL